MSQSRASTKDQSKLKLETSSLYFKRGETKKLEIMIDLGSGHLIGQKEQCNLDVQIKSSCL